jgi:hypothetical protein
VAFTAQVVDGNNHLYDLVYLRTHPLAQVVTPDADVPLKKKAWLLHDVLPGLMIVEMVGSGKQRPCAPVGLGIGRGRLSGEARG